MKYPYLKDSSFLKQIDLLKNKEQFIKIIVLDWDERPIQDIQGRVTGGSISINGSSNIRRTANLTFVVKNNEGNISNPENLLSLNKKVSMELGITNTTGQYENYPTIWFPLGIYVINSLSTSHSNTGLTVSISMKDKMCLLNGECGGTLPASVTFNEIEDLDEDGNIIITYPTLYQIIQEAVNHWGGEQLGKIIISDLDTRVKQVMKWVGSVPVFRYQEKNTSTGEWAYGLTTNETWVKEDHAAAIAAGTFAYESFDYGRDIGYIYTDFTYSGGDLVGDAGSSVTDVLDKIKSLLGNYEYFYDLDGNFVFQEIKNYLNTSQSTVVLNELNNNSYLINQSSGKSVYTFDDSTLITSYSNAPQLNMIKNDFIVWGIRETSTGAKRSIRYHLAIDKKPTIGTAHKVFEYIDPDDNLTKAKSTISFANYSSLPATGTSGIFYYVESENTIYQWSLSKKTYVALESSYLHTITSKDWRTELYLEGVDAEPFGTDSNYYYTELQNEWPKLYDLENGKFYDEVIATPSDCDFFLDFIDAQSAKLGAFSVSNIGRRSKVITDDNVNCVFAPDIPDWILIETNQDDTTTRMQEAIKKGQKYILVDIGIYESLATGGSLNSAFDAVRDLLYQYTGYNEKVTIQCIPIYYLDANTRITVNDIASDISGDYMIDSISIPLDLSGTMSISATRALEKI